MDTLRIRQTLRLYNLITLLGCGGFAFAWSKSGNALSSMAFGFSMFLIGDYFRVLGSRPIVFKETILLFCALQLLFAPFCAYWLVDTGATYQMEIPPNDYFGFAFPSILSLWAGFLFWRGSASPVGPFRRSIRISSTLGNSLIVISWVCTGVASVAPPSIAFILWIFTAMGLVTAISDVSKPWQCIPVWRVIVAFIPFLVASLSFGMFHELLVWGAWITPVLVWKKGIPKVFTILTMIGLFMVAMLLDTAKADYRSRILAGKPIGIGEKIRILHESISLEDDHENLSFWGGRIRRLNQGYLVTKVMRWIPQMRPFDHGQSIVESIEASILPRFFAPDKREVGGRENMLRFTGIDVPGGTSMNIGILGEFWGNFGHWGILAYAMLGTMLHFLSRGVIRLLLYFRGGVWFYPLIMCSWINAEGDFYAPFNNTVKVLLLVLPFLWVCNLISSHDVAADHLRRGRRMVRSSNKGGIS